MNAVVKAIELPEPVARRGITEPQWRTLANNLYPGADVNSVLMVWDYCVARKLDPLKKPCHIVPMEIKDSKTGEYGWRDVVMPGIYEYRTTATRTGLYLGHSKPEYGELTDYLGLEAPQYCEMTVYRWNEAARARAEYPVKVIFREVAATRKDKKTGDIGINARWTKAPIQMLTKCTEAAALREAFPDELGGTSTVEEMEGHAIDADNSVGNWRAEVFKDFTEADQFKVNEYVNSIVDIMAQDKEEIEISRELNEVKRELDKFPEMSIAVMDKLKKEGIISRAKWDEYLNVVTKQTERQHG